MGNKHKQELTPKQKEEKANATKAKKQENFKRIAEKRTNKAIKAIMLIGNLSGSNYTSDEEQVKKVIDALNGAVSVVAKSFEKTEKVTIEFNL